MSMRCYSINEMGLIVRVSELNLKELKPFVSNDDDDDIEELIQYEQIYFGDTFQDGCLCHKSTFGNDIEGDIYLLLKSWEMCEVKMKEDWVLFTLPAYPNLFETAYENKEDLITKMKALYSKYIATHIDYEKRLVTISGVTWG